MQTESILFFQAQSHNWPYWKLSSIGDHTVSLPVDKETKATLHIAKLRDGSLEQENNQIGLIIEEVQVWYDTTGYTQFISQSSSISAWSSAASP